MGAGPAGLATGHELAAHGVAVTVLERNGYVGGLCRTVHDAGYRFDLGGHRWFTKNDDLNDWFCRLMDGELVTVKRISRIYYDGKYYMYPVAIGDVLKNAGPFTTIRAGVSFLWAAIRYAALNRPIRNMKDAYIAQFGATLYEMFFRHYTEKVWGRPCEALSADWVAQRSQGLSISSIARQALSTRARGVRSLIEEFMYPRDGYVRIPERMAEDLERAGHDVLLNASVTRVVVHGPNDVEVTYGTPQGERSIRAHDVVSTIPLSLLARIITPQPGQAVLQASLGLSYRDLITVNLKLNRKQVSTDTWLYVQDQDILFGRLHEPKNWSRAMVPDDDHTSLVLECFCTAGDAIWTLSDDEVAHRCVRDLTEKLGFIEPGDVAGWNVVRTRFAYPVYDHEYSSKLAVINDFIKQFAGLHVVGRTGAFRYNNADHSIEMGLLLARKILGYDVDPMEVNTEQEYHEIKRTDKRAARRLPLSEPIERGRGEGRRAKR